MTRTGEQSPGLSGLEKSIFFISSKFAYLPSPFVSRVREAGSSVGKWSVWISVAVCTFQVAQMEQPQTAPIYYLIVSRGEWLPLSACCHAEGAKCVPAVVLF